jgi:alkaline phosphatase D
MINKFDNRHNPLVRFDCESLLDASGNGLNLTGATAIFRQVYENVVGMSPSGVVSRNGVSDASLRNYGDITVQMLLILRAVPNNVWTIAFQAAGETETTNNVWAIRLTNQTTLAYLGENGNGLDTYYSAAPLQRGLPAYNVPFYLAMRRRAVTGGVVVQFFINGVPYGPPSGVMTASTGGATSQLTINHAGTTPPDVFGVEIDGIVLTDVQILDSYNDTLGEEFGLLVPTVKSLWVGALTDSSATVVAKLTYAANAMRLAVTGPGGTTYTDPVDVDHDEAAKFAITGLDADTEYTYEVQLDVETVEGPMGGFRTAPSGNASFTVAFAGDALKASNAAVFDTIRELDPLLFLHLGDAHYNNIAVNDPALFNAAYDEILTQPRQAELFSTVPIAYMWDDHDYGPNNSDASSPSKVASCATYRARVPHYPLVDGTSIYQTFDIGRVRFVLTDQRSAASLDSAADNSSKSMLGSAQKTWFKDLLSNSSGYLIVWICPRVFGGVALAGGDHWGGFTTERAELVSHINANCSSRVIVLSADGHFLGIDDGSNHDFLPGGGEPIRTFQAAPLDIVSPGAYGGGTYSSGVFTGTNQFGTMQIEDSGGSSLDVTWRGFDGTGTQLASLAFTVNI